MSLKASSVCVVCVGLVFSGLALTEPSADSGIGRAQGDVILDPGDNQNKNITVSAVNGGSGPGQAGELRSDVAMYNYDIVCDGKNDWNTVEITKMINNVSKTIVFVKLNSRVIFYDQDLDRVVNYCEYSEPGACAGAGLPQEISGAYTSLKVYKHPNTTDTCWKANEEPKQIKLQFAKYGP